MSALLLLATCLGLGYIVGQSGRAPAGVGRAIAWFALNVALPALAVHLVSQLHFERALAFLFVSQWAIFAAAWLVVRLVGGRIGWTRSRIGAVTLVAGLGNTSFLGYPLIEALRGAEGLELAVVADQAGAFMALATGGVVVASMCAGREVRLSAIARRIVMFPPFAGFVVGLVFAITGWMWPPLDAVLARLGATLSPLALFAIGTQLRWRIERSEAAAVAVALGWKLVLAPLLVFAAAVALAIGREIRDIATLQAAMAPMISATLLAEQEGLDAPLATAILGVGILASLVTVPALDALLSRL